MESFKVGQCYGFEEDLWFMVLEGVELLTAENCFRQHMGSEYANGVHSN